MTGSFWYSVTISRLLYFLKFKVIKCGSWTFLFRLPRSIGNNIAIVAGIIPAPTALKTAFLLVAGFETASTLPAIGGDEPSTDV